MTEVQVWSQLGGIVFFAGVWLTSSGEMNDPEAIVKKLRKFGLKLDVDAADLIDQLQEEMAKLRHEAGMYRSLYENAIPDAAATARKISGTESCACHFIGAGTHHVEGCRQGSFDSTTDAATPLRDAVQYVVDKFKQDEAQGYHTKDRKFAIEILDKAISAHKCFDSTTDETAWLIEINEPVSGPIYFQLEYDNDWTMDADKALRFARAQDAQAYIDHIGWTRPKPVEHMWCSVSRPHHGDEPC